MYLTVAQLMRSFQAQMLVQLSNDDHRATEVDEAVLVQAITIAGERIDAALRSRYQLPLTDTPTMLETYCLHLARHWLYARRPETKLPETVKECYSQTIKELEQIALGRLHLGLKAVQTETETTTGDLLPDVGEYAVRAPKRLDTGGY